MDALHDSDTAGLDVHFQARYKLLTKSKTANRKFVHPPYWLDMLLRFGSSFKVKRQARSLPFGDFELGAYFLPAALTRAERRDL